MNWLKAAIPNMLTCCNLLAGVLGIINVFQGDPTDTIYFILIAAGFDFLDGLMARVLKVTSEIGKQLDSLADMVSFGTLPALFLFTHLGNMGMADEKFVPLLIVPFSALRLAKFNIDDDQKDKFLGLPTPANALFVSSLGLVTWILPSWIWVLISLISAVILVIPLPLIALKFKSPSLQENWPKYLLLLISVILLAIYQGFSAIPSIMIAYILVSLFTNLFQKTTV